jgi:XTP/dITP diphosphohydrolase
VSITLLVATHNAGKIREYRALLGDLPLHVTWLDAEGITHEVAETADSYAGNAALKALEYARLSGHWTWADDSGLSVDALGGRPGVHSARYGGPGLRDADRWALVLDELRALPHSQWTAAFHCTVAIATPDGALHLVDGRLDGQITDEPRGSHGFGYDPIFYLPEWGCTLAELEPATKNQISHRAVASRAARSLLAELLAAGHPAATTAVDRPGESG